MSVEVKAQNSISMTSIKAIKDATDQSAQLLATMEQYAQQAGTTLTGIYQDAEDAKANAQNASEYASRALGNLSTVQSVAETLTWITQHGTMTLTADLTLDPTHVYFVADPNGDYVVGNTHYSIVTEPDVADISTYYELSINESLNNYVATHLAVTAEGLWIIPDDGGNKVLIATGQGTTYTTAGTYIIGKVNNTDVVLASFLSNEATIGQLSGGHTIIQTSGMQIYGSDGTKQLANIGYGDGKSATGTTTKAPYYTFGTRLTGYDIGNYSVTEGTSNVAEGYGSHAEGNYTKAIGFCAHAEGEAGTASGDYSHAEGQSSRAEGNHSHAEGMIVVASGHASHAQNLGTRAINDYQTAIGKWNQYGHSSAYALIIGNGADDNNRSNAFVFTWDGNVQIDLAGYQTTDNVDKTIYDALVALGWDSEVTA